jgi:hypothetical protein
MVVPLRLVLDEAENGNGEFWISLRHGTRSDPRSEPMCPRRFLISEQGPETHRPRLSGLRTSRTRPPRSIAPSPGSLKKRAEPTSCQLQAPFASRHLIVRDKFSPQVELTRSQTSSGTAAPGATVGFRQRPQSDLSVSMVVPGDRRVSALSGSSHASKVQSWMRVRPGRTE